MFCIGNLLLQIFTLGLEGLVKACLVGLTDAYKTMLYLYTKPKFIHLVEISQDNWAGLDKALKGENLQ